ncbi:DnaJ-domain-containing protein [Clavulina sp. PMI_390]|nr:DnaJ-domain-containing protein [Clavulina sp. PMI_390]
MSSSHGPLPQYYDLLHVSPTATTEEIRTAYKKESLRTHPDRQPNATPAQRKVLTEKFQAVADAYYVLSDTQRRREYDALLRTRGFRTSGFTSSAAGAGASSSSGPGPTFGSTDPAASAAFFDQFWQYFSKAAGGNAHKKSSEEDVEVEEEFEEEIPAASAGAWGSGNRPNADGVFTDVFEEMLRPEVQRTVNWWTYIGALSGASLGFILANVPGALAGGLAGNRLGAIRDAKGKPVVQVFAQLEGTEKAQILKALAIKVFGSLTAM